MSVINYVLVGLLGTIVGIALYMAKVEISHGSALEEAAPLSDLS